jgi:hypothetical protein
MTITLSWGGRVALLLSAVGLLPVLLPGPPIPSHVPSPRFHDWTTRHALYTQTGTARALEAARIDPRALSRWREVEQREFALRQPFRFFAPRLRNPPRRFPLREGNALRRDWSISLGTAGTANSMYPAKFSFDTTATPSCTNDFVVFPVNAAGSAAQPNIVAFNNLYSGNAGTTGICDGRATPNGHSDTKTSATVLWSYNVQAVAGGAPVPGSPVLSLDGQKVAFVESGGGAGHFHVLAWKSGDGQNANLQTVATPASIVGFTNPNAPAAGSGTASETPFGSALDTLSSPYVDYANDTAYVGNDAGVLFRIKNVFCTLGSCGNAAPSLDTTWGPGGAITVCAGKLTAPVLDFINLKLYVGCSDGKLYAISQSGAITSLVVGDGVAAKTFGGIVDPPLVDGVNGFVYAVSGSAGNGANGVLVQAKADFSSSVAVPIGAGNRCNIHSPMVNNAYFTNPGGANALIYIGGVTGNVGPCTAAGATGGSAVLYGASFNASGVLNTGAPAHFLVSANPVGSEYAPMGEFFNPNTGADLLFVGLLRNNTHGGFVNLYSFPATTGWNATFQNSILEGLGPSGMVIDNFSASAQASSIYFNALDEDAGCTNPQTGANTGGCAVKLTQASFQ